MSDADPDNPAEDAGVFDFGDECQPEDEDGMGEPVGSCDECCVNLYEDDDPFYCDQCLWRLRRL